MEKLSNDIDALRRTAKHEINQFKFAPGETQIAYFSEIPSIAGFPYKIALVRNQAGEIRSEFRQWDTAYDFKRWPNGIYNLNRIRIITHTVHLTPEDQQKLTAACDEILAIKKLPQDIDRPSAIVLDGYDWSLGIHCGSIRVDYRWRAATEDIRYFIPFIEFLKRLHQSANKRH